MIVTHIVMFRFLGGASATAPSVGGFLVRNRHSKPLKVQHVLGRI